jgi:hypothetical protein
MRTAMSNVFAELAGRVQRPPVWIDFESYAARVFAGTPADWLVNAHRFADAMVQAHKLVRSDVVALDLTQAALAKAAPGTDLSLADRIGAWAPDTASHRFNTDVLDEVFHRLGAQAALVMALPSPSRLLRAWGVAPPFDFDDLDDVASALVSLLRQHADRRFTALVIDCDEASGPSDDELEACAPLQKSANYYGWGVAWRLDALPEGELPDGLLAATGVDSVLVGGWSDAALAAQGDPRLAGGLNDAYWCDETDRAPGSPGMRFGAIPPQALPERVAGRLHLLRS